VIEISELLTPRDVIPQLRVGNKKQVLQEVARRAGLATGIPERRIYDVLSERERQEGNVMQICISRCKGQRLVLDL